MIAEVSWKDLELVRLQLDEKIEKSTREIRLLIKELDERLTDERKELLKSIKKQLYVLRVFGWSEEPEALLDSMVEEIEKVIGMEVLMVKELEKEQYACVESRDNCKWLRRFIENCNPVENIGLVESKLAMLEEDELNGCPDGSIDLAIRFAHEMLLAAKEEPCEQN